MRNVFLGTSAFAAAVLERLAASAHRPLLVVSRPDRPAGRGRRLTAPPVADAARALGLDLIQPDDLHSPESLARIAAAEPEALCVCAYGVLIREPLLSAHELYNVHPSLLPRWRGAAPIERALLAGDAETGVSIMHLVEALDAGPVALQACEAIREDDDAGTLGERLQIIGGDLLVQALDQRPPFRDQPADGVTYADKIGARDRDIDPANPARAEERRVRALHPHVGARLQLPDGSALGVRRARLADSGSTPGSLGASGERLLLGCRDGALELLEVQPPGGRSMPAGDWLRGRAGAAPARSPLQLTPPPS